jgi:hypothetical protein
LNSAGRRARREFNIPSGVRVDSVSIGRALHRDLSLGSPDSVVIAYLARRRIFEDSTSLRTDHPAGDVQPGPLEKWYWSDEKRILVLNFAYDPRQLCLVCWDFNVAFHFDSSRRLTAISVHEGLTGL